MLQSEEEQDPGCQGRSSLNCIVGSYLIPIEEFQSSRFFVPTRNIHPSFQKRIASLIKEIHFWTGGIKQEKN